MRPGLILLDEPTANLDPAGVIEVREAVERVVSQTGATLVVVEHRVAVWKDLVNRVVVLETGGGLQADGEPDVVLGLNGAALAASGIWVPEFPPAKPARTPQAHPRLLHTEDLGITRVPSTILQSGIELEVRAARALALTGPNGAGKSTLALTIAGLLAPAQGRVVADELASGLSEDPISWKSRELVTRIGTVFQDPEHQFLAGTVRAELSIGPKALGWAQESTESRISEVAERLRLGHLIQANPFTLSGGEKRRLSVATVLITRPPLLVLDEPTFGQDSRTWQELVAFLAELLNEGNAIVAASHDREFIDALADEEYVMPAPLARAPRAVGA
jgi:energy-coupling factor transport system ATP-binding protein